MGAAIAASGQTVPQRNAWCGAVITGISSKRKGIEMLNKKAENFVAALSVARDVGLAPFAVFVHAAHETAMFTRCVGQHNYWGIKPPRSIPYAGKTVEVWTHEDSMATPGETESQALPRLIRVWGENNIRIEKQFVFAGKTYWHIGIPQTFVDFDTAKDAIAYYVTYQIQRLYPNAWAGRADPFAFYQGLMNGRYKWASDPNYVTSLVSMHQQLAKRADTKAILTNA